METYPLQNIHCQQLVAIEVRTLRNLFLDLRHDVNKFFRRSSTKNLNESIDLHLG
jgi:hypothetical protein